MKNEILGLMQFHTKEDPVYSPEIEKKFEITGCQVRDNIRELRREGYPIANTNGYFYATCWDEILPTIEDLHQRAMSLLVTEKALRKTFNKEEEFAFKEE